MAESLTPQQLQAVETRGGRLLVSAAAGSGKTRVLVERLMHYLARENANIDEFLIITYTNAAAAELRSKISTGLAKWLADHPENRHMQRQIQRLYLTKISTVHGFCGDLLRENAYRLDLPANFRVADAQECLQIRQAAMDRVLEEVYDAIGDDPELQAFVDTQGLGRNDALVPEIVETVYDSARCHLSPEAWLEDCLTHSNGEGVTDAGQTPWGKSLMEDLFSYLDLQIAALGECAAAAAAIDGWKKPTALLQDTMAQLAALRNSKTWDEVVARRNIDYGYLTFPKKNADPEFASRVKAVRNACKEEVKKRTAVFSDSSRQVLQDLASSAMAVKGILKLVRRFDREYARRKKSRGVLDFGDLEHKALDLLLGKDRAAPTGAAREIGRRFREIMVDEYQDSNAVQDAIFSALTKERGNLFMVGDVKQSIYQFRLADPEIFLEKYRRYAPVEAQDPGEGRKIYLSHNFRSGGAILSAVNDVFSQCMSEKVGGLVYGEAEALREPEGKSDLPLGEPEVELHVLQTRENTEAEEAAYVADRIICLLDGSHSVRQGDALRPIQPEDIVILLRSPGPVGAVFREALEARGIPCNSEGGNLLKTEEIRVLWSLLQVLQNPRQDIPLIAVLASPLFRFTADELAEIRSTHLRECFFDAVTAQKTEKMSSFLAVLNTLREEARLGSLSQLLTRIFLLTRMDSIYGAMNGGESRLANLQEFYRLAVAYENCGRRDLGQFLDYLEALSQKGLPANYGKGTGVTIMSIHKSKGLEFPVVFLCGLARTFNRESLQDPVLCHKVLGLGLSWVEPKNRIRYPTIAKRAISAKIAADSISEEMRVLYVAMTRAMDRLIMTYASHYSRNLARMLSDLRMRMETGSRELLAGSVSCPGEWILLTALGRREAEALFALAGRPEQTREAGPAWKILLALPPEPSETSPQEAVQERFSPPEEITDRLRAGLSFRYPYRPATETPSKQTATQRKGRIKDQEAAENARPERRQPRPWRKPSFVQGTSQGAPQGAAYGNAMHAAMQFLRYAQCTGEAGVAQEIRRLVEERLLTPEQGALVNCESLAAFFDTPLGQKLRTSDHVLREFKFSILKKGEEYGPGLEGEKILLQGVVDCALLEPDGITVVDFKTDHVTENTLPEVTERYRLQVETYAQALSRIYGCGVKEALLYFFHIGQFVKIL